MSKTRLGIQIYGGGDPQYRNIIADQTGGFSSHGYVDSDELKIAVPEEKDYDETGTMIDIIETSKDLQFIVGMKQSRIADINIILNTAGIYRSLYYVSPLRDGNYQHVFVPVAKPSRNLNVKFERAKRMIVLTYNILKQPASYSWPTGFAQYADFPFSFFDGASIVAAPTTNLPTTATI